MISKSDKFINSIFVLTTPSQLLFSEILSYPIFVFIEYSVSDVFLNCWVVVGGFFGTV